MLNRQAISFYLLYPFMYLTALLPFWLLYRVSDFLYLLLSLSGYRKKVVLQNLRNSFPDKSEKEIQTIRKKFFRYLTDLILESIKMMRMGKEESAAICTMENPMWLQQLYEQKQSILIVMGHYGNWEWISVGASLHIPYPFSIIYRPLSNPYFEKMMYAMRTRLGTIIIPAQQVLRKMVAKRNTVTATAIVADQYPPAEGKIWIDFLRQDTGFFTGPEKLAIKFDYPVVYFKITRIKRGHYHITPKLLFNHPRQTQPGEITRTFAKQLENDIQAQPEFWLWSHKRWKHMR